MLNIFKTSISSIFVKTWSGLIWEGPEYGSDGLNKIANDISGEMMVSNLTKPIFIPTFDMTNKSVLLG